MSGQSGTPLPVGFERFHRRRFVDYQLNRAARPRVSSSPPPASSSGHHDAVPRASAFDAIFAAGRSAVRSASHRVEGDPLATGRWGPSVVVLPSGEIAEGLSDLADQVVEILGGSHWPSAGNGRAHVTVRALEPYAESTDLERVHRYTDALHRALDGVGPLEFEFSGVGLSPAGVMVCAHPLTSSANALRKNLGHELGSDGWLEENVFERGRDPIWYCSLVHYAERVGRVDQLLEWVSARQETSLGSQRFESVTICRWLFDGEAMAPKVLASLPADDTN